MRIFVFSCIWPAVIISYLCIYRISGFECCREQKRQPIWKPAVLFSNVPRYPQIRRYNAAIIRRRYSDISIQKEHPSAQYIVDKYCGKTSCFLSNRQITNLDDVRFPINITRIDLSNNLLASLQNVIFPPLLRELRLDENELRLSEMTDLSYLNALSDLSLLNNKITSLNAITFPPNLQILSLRGNQISSKHFYDFDFSHLHSLFYLDFGANNLSSFNGDIATKLPKNIEVFDVDNNQISEMVMAKIPKKLKLLNLANNELDYIEIENIDDFPAGNCSLKVELFGNPMRARADGDYSHLIGVNENEGLMQEASRWSHPSINYATPFRSKFKTPQRNEPFGTPATGLSNDVAYSPLSPAIPSVLSD